MRKHIRIKVKTLLVLIPIALILLFSNQIYWQGIKLYNAIAPEKYMISLEELSTGSLKSENSRLDLIYRENNYDIFMLVTIEDGYTVSGMRLSSSDSEKIHTTYLSYKNKYNLPKDYPNYVINVALAQWFSGKTDLAMDILNEFDQTTATDEVHLVKSGMLLGLYDFEGVIDQLASVQSQEYQETKRNILYLLNHAMGIEVPADSLNAFEIKKDHYNLDSYEGTYSHLFSNIYEINAYLDGNFNNGFEPRGTLTDKSISGYVTLNGNPVQGAFIYEKRHSGMSSHSYLEAEVLATDADGSYILDQTHDDIKGIGIAVSWHVIHNKQIIRDFYEFYDVMTDTTYDFKFYDGVRFSRFEIKGDEIHFEIEDPLHGPSRTYVIRARHTDPKYDVNAYANSSIIGSGLEGVLSLDALRLNSNFAFDFSSSKDELAIDRFMEPLYLSGEYAFEVSAQLESERDLYVSNGFFTDALYIYESVEGQDEPSLGDMLLSEGKIDEAISWYAEDRSMHSLKVLISLYSKGRYVVDNHEFWQELGGQDPEKAIAYTRELMDVYGQSKEWLTKLARLYKDAMRFEEEREVYATLIEMNPEAIYYQEAYALAAIRAGDFISGFEILDSSSAEASRFSLKEALAILGGLHDEVSAPYRAFLDEIDGVDGFSAFHQLIQKGQYKEAKKWLESADASDLKVMYSLILEDQFRHLYPEGLPGGYDDFVTYYRETVESLDSGPIVDLLKHLKKFHNWF